MAANPLILPTRVELAEPTARPDFGTVGSTGLPLYNSVLFDEHLPELTGYRWDRVALEMMTNDPVTAAAMHAIEMMIRRVEWWTDPATADASAQEEADWVNLARTDMAITWEETIAEALSFIPYGWSVQEIIYKLRQGEASPEDAPSAFDDGRIGWNLWAPRPQETRYGWELDQHGRPSVLLQQAPPRWEIVSVPLKDKAILFRTTSRKLSPEGVSKLRQAYIPWFFRKNLMRIEAIGYERNLAGLPVYLIPADVIKAKGPEYQEYVRAATNIRVDERHGVVSASDRDEHGNLKYELKLLSPTGQTQSNIDVAIRRHATQQFMALCLTDFLMVGHQEVGTYATSVSKTRLFIDGLEAWCDAIAAAINEQAIKPLMRFNGVDPRLWPTLKHGQVRSADLTEMGLFLLQMSQAQLLDVTDPDLRQWILETANIPVEVKTGGQEAEAGGENPPTQPPPAPKPDAPPTPDGTPAPPAGGKAVAAP